MKINDFCGSLNLPAPPSNLTLPLQALWWDANVDWTRAHELVDELDTLAGMAVHAYLHRKEGEQWNADYWYSRCGRDYYRPELKDEWTSLVTALLA